MRRSMLVVATVLVVLAYLGLALLITTQGQTYSLMIVFGVLFFSITTIYVAAVSRSGPAKGMKTAFRVSAAATMLVVYFAMWEYWGGGGPYPPNGLFSPSINLGCSTPSGGCFLVDAWLVFAALLVADAIILWPLVHRGKFMSRRVTPSGGS